MVFITQHKIILLKTNFWIHKMTYFKFVPYNHLSKSKFLQQKFCSSHYPFVFHNKNLAKKLSDFDEILTSKSTQMVFLVVKSLSKSDNFLAKFNLIQMRVPRQCVKEMTSKKNRSRLAEIWLFLNKTFRCYLLSWSWPLTLQQQTNVCDI